MKPESCWPTALQEQLLRACFGNGGEAAGAFEAWRRQVRLSDLDDVSTRFLALLYRRAPDTLLDLETRELGQRAWLTIWQQSRRRYELASEVLREFEQAGIEGLILKGMALTLGYYQDSGMRPMGDVDILIREQDVHRAVDHLRMVGWDPEEGLSAIEIVSQMRVRHAWQFTRSDEESVDLHWRPIPRCYAPLVTQHFWRASAAVNIAGSAALIPCATDQLFHVCAHGLQWSWTPQIRWIADALTILESAPAIDWERLLELARAANMTVRIRHALDYLRTRFAVALPNELIESGAAEAWEEREYALLQKPCPLGPLDSARWHVTNFRRLRPFDPAWNSKPYWVAFPEYLAQSLNISGARELPPAMWRQLRARIAIRSGADLQ